MYRRQRHVGRFPTLSNVVASRLFFGKGDKSSADTSNNNGSSSSSSSNNNNNNNNNKGKENIGGGFPGMFPGGAGGLPPGFDMQKLRAMQDMISSQPPEKQMEMVKKALEFQKTLGKIPGIGKLAQKNIEVMEQLLKNTENQQQQQQGSSKSSDVSSPSSPLSGKKTSLGSTFSNSFAAASAAAAAAAASSSNCSSGNCGSGTSVKSGSGPTIDELKKINLGPEIEALFAELRSMRMKKNSYRDQLLSKEEELEKTQKNLQQMQETESSLRSKLRKVEQDVLLLNSENMELREHEKEWRQVRQKNEELVGTVQRLQHSDAAQDRQRSDVLQQQLQFKEDALRSMQRKLERLRRRDPLLQFSRLCSDVSRACGEGEYNNDEAFTALQTAYEAQQEQAWQTAAEQNGAAAHAYIAVVRRFFETRVPHALYDAVVAVEGDVEALRSAITLIGLQLQPLHTQQDGRYVITAPADTAVSKSFVGPYALSVALYLAGKTSFLSTSKGTGGGGGGGRGVEKSCMPFKVTLAYPHISTTLFSNSKRASVQYETARSSGPGGQAANVAETQITAKLFIDGEMAYVAESQDSRSALNNREAATEKLGKARRQQYNENLAKQERVEVVEKQLVHIISEHTKNNSFTSNNNNKGSNSENGGDVAPAMVVDMTRAALEKGFIKQVEFALVCGMYQLNQTAATNVAETASARTAPSS